MVQERILVVDDDQGLLQLLKMRLGAMGFAVTSCDNGDEAIALARQEVFDLAITDQRLQIRPEPRNLGHAQSVLGDIDRLPRQVRRCTFSSHRRSIPVRPHQPLLHLHRPHRGGHLDWFMEVRIKVP